MGERAQDGRGAGERKVGGDLRIEGVLKRRRLGRTQDRRGADEKLGAISG